MLRERGFTLIEIMVSVSIFVVVMTVAMGAVLGSVNANRKAQSLGTITNNLNIAFESMIRDLRTGQDYSVSSSNRRVDFTDKDGNSVTYTFNSSGKYISKTTSDTNGASGRINGNDVVVNSMTFTLKGEGSSDGQPILLLNIQGTAGDGRTASDFNVQTLVTSRVLDISEL